MPERRDEFVQATNNSSIVSKRSVEELYGDILYPQQKEVSNEKLSYFKYVVPKFKRRSPNVNRGYLLRLLIFKDTIKKILKSSNQKPGKKYIVNLGCGFDPSAFEYLDLANKFQKELYKDLIFIDIDYPDLIDIKVKMIKQSEELCSLIKLNDVDEANHSLDDKVFPISTSNYIAVKCDLNDSTSFKRVLADLQISDLNNDALKIFIAEVSITYMDPDKADAVIESVIGCKSCHFLILEHLLANEDFDDKFVKRMLYHFNKINSPIKSVQDRYRTVNDQITRYNKISKNKGVFEMVTLMKYWNTYVCNKLKQRIDEIEPFDEFEEFSLFCMHYYFGHYTNTNFDLFPDKDVGFIDTDKIPIAHSNNDIAFDFKIQKDSKLTERRFNACSIFSENDNSVLLNSGFAQSKLNSSVLLSNSDNDTFSLKNNEAPGSRICHCITKVKSESSTFVLTGGRTAPEKRLKDVWILEKPDNGSSFEWRRSADMNVARSRHNVFVSKKGDVIAANGGEGVERFNVQTEKWEKVTVKGLYAFNLKSAALAFDSASNTGYMCGGMTPDGIINDKLYKFELSDDESTIQVELLGRHFIIGRYSAKLVIYKSKLILMGGVSEVFINDKSTTIILISLRNNNFDVERYFIDDSSWKDFPILVCGDLAINTRANEFFYIGGGIVCFSFGSYWNNILQIKIKDNKKASNSIIRSDIFAHITLEQRPSVKTASKDANRQKVSKNINKLSPIEIQDISKVVLDDTNIKKLEKIIYTSTTPLIIQGLKLGDCVHCWNDANYLISKIGQDKQFKISESGESIKFGDYVNDLFSIKNEKSKTKKKLNFNLGSLSSNVTFLNVDFPEISRDFQSPLKSGKDILKFSSVKTTIPLSINDSSESKFITSQIVGSRMVKTYPASQCSLLGFSDDNNGNISNIKDIFNKNPNLSFNTDVKLTPFQGNLNSGDILVVPSNWAFSTKVNGGDTPSISVDYKIQPI